MRLSLHTSSGSVRQCLMAQAPCSTRPLALRILLRPSVPLPSRIQIRTLTSSLRRASATPSRFTYHISASFSAKDARYNPHKHTFVFNPHNTIRRNRADKRTRPASGQDAFFVSSVSKPGSNSLAFGVADGVGGWVDSGVDPADFSHAFCDYMAWAASKWPEQDKKGGKTVPDARQLMQIGYDSVKEDKNIPAGGSTACVGVLKEEGEMEVANLGDSGFIILRLGAVHEYSDAQTHAFNTPFQLSVIPPAQRARTAAFGGTQLQDYPKDAAVTRHEVRHGDVIIFATDGVWDNLSASDVLRIVSRLMVGCKAWQVTEEGIKVTESLNDYTIPNTPDGAEDRPSLQSFLAVGVAGQAKAASVNTKLDGPFAKEVQRYYPEENWRGGKVDDICVVVAVVSEEGR